MAYITKANAKRILKRINLSSIGNIEGDVYKKPIYFLSSWETKYLLLMQSLLKEPDKFAIEVYQPVVNKDTYRFVFESEQQPSYHTNKDCVRMKSHYNNLEIPFEILDRARELGGEELVKKEVISFRDWFKLHFELYQNNKESFLKQLEIRWRVERNISEIDKENSGIESIENYSLIELEQEIDKIISDAGAYFKSKPNRQNIIRRFQKLTFLAYKPDVIQNNDTELNDYELKEFLKEYDVQFKKPIKELLVEYYRVKYNPELSFDSNILDALNFRICSSCDGAEDFVYLVDSPMICDNEGDVVDELPF